MAVTVVMVNSDPLFVSINVDEGNEILLHHCFFPHLQHTQ